MPDSDKAARKRRLKAQYRAEAKRARFGLQGPGLQPGIRGFFCTTNGNEKFSVREVYNLLNEYAVKLYGEEFCEGSGNRTVKSDGASPAEDLSLEQELELLRGQSSSSTIPPPVSSSSPPDHCEDDRSRPNTNGTDTAQNRAVDERRNTCCVRRFQQIKCPVKGCIFIKTTLSECSPLVEYMMQDISDRGIRRARFTSRIVPVQVVCKANAEALEKSCETLIEQRLPNNTDSFSYSVVYKSRHHCCLSWQQTRATITHLMSLMRPLSRPLVQHADWYFLVEGVANTLLLSLARDYQRLSLFNLQKMVTAQGRAQAERDEGEGMVVVGIGCDREKEGVLGESEDVAEEGGLEEGSNSQEGPETASDQH